MAGKSKREMKRSESVDSGGSESKKPRIDLYVELRILLPNKVTGAIIGRGGENIKRLRRNFLANINLPTCIGPERILTITAELTVTCNILSDIIPTISTDTCRDENEVRILLNCKQAGAVIGKRGETVKDLRERSGSVIKVFEERCPDSTDQVVQMRGTSSAIMRCIRLILKTIEHVRPSGSRMNYDPNNYDSLSASRYGGYELQGLKSHVKTTRDKSENDDSPEIRKSPSASSLSTTADDTRSVPDQKNASVTSDPCLSTTTTTTNTNTVSENGNTKTTRTDSSNPLNPDKNRRKRNLNGSRLPVLTSPQRTSNVSQVPSLLSFHLPPERQRCVELREKPLATRTTPLIDFRSSRKTNLLPFGVQFSSQPIKLSINQPTSQLINQPASQLINQPGSQSKAEAFVDRMFSAVSCLMASASAGAAAAAGVRMNSVTNGKMKITQNSDSDNTQTIQKDSVVNGNCRRTQPVVTSQVWIPTELVNIIMGKENRQVKLIESMTYTKIWIDNVRGQTSDYVINITGSPEQISCALGLIQSIVKKHAFGQMQRPRMK